MEAQQSEGRYCVPCTMQSEGRQAQTHTRAGLREWGDEEQNRDEQGWFRRKPV